MAEPHIDSLNHTGAWEWQAQPQPEQFVYVPQCNQHIHSHWFKPHYWQEQNAVMAVRVGRGKTYFIAHEGRTMVLRRYLRGGMVRHLTKDKFFYRGLDQTRVQREIDLLLYMRTQGLNVPNPIAGWCKQSTFTYRNALLLEAFPHAQDFHHHLCKEPLAEDLWRHAGRMVKKMHDLDIYHHDLNIHNILADAQQAVWLIDFDRCEHRPQNNQAELWKAANIARLKRSLDKEQLRMNEYYMDESQWQAFLSGYHE